ncbi:hypothetical protein IQ06DRAFT_48559 [Phaeosphaeriaceae sp. SRC1lsM3a]|nr:hypothetical protein IQ06DRAFT_48559 [Stagonospora sp. SRC1lsM3a]
MSDRVTLAQRLLDGYCSKALELLVDYLQDKEVRAETERYIGQNDPSPSRLDSTTEQPRTIRQSIPNASHGLHTPSTSAGSTKSHASSLATAGVEKIYLLASDTDDQDWPVTSRSVTIKHNLIGDRVVHSRGLDANVDLVDELVHLPHGGQRLVRTTKCVRLTWRRRNEFTTNVDTFYIVSAKLLESDVIMSSDGWLEHQLPSDIEEAHSPQGRFQRKGLVLMEERDPAIPPRAPTAPIHPDQLPDLTSHVQRVYERAQDLRDTQRMHEADRVFPAAQSRPIDHGQPSHMATPVAAEEPTKGQLQVTGLWDKTPIKFLIDLDASGEAFYQAFLQWASRRKRDGEVQRDRMTVYLRTNKQTPENEAYELSLKQSELEELWQAAVDWIQENKSVKAPNLYATIELEPG